MLVDSNILVYAINRSSPKHLKAQQFLLAYHHQLKVAHQNIFETLRVLTHSKFPHPLSLHAALIAIGGITDACTIVSPDYRSLHIALELISKHNLASDQIFDAYLAATAITHDIRTIVTDNTKDFRIFSQFNTLNPFK